MASIVNARDILLQATNPRVLSVPLPSNVVVPTDAVPGLTDVYNSTKEIVLQASSLLFQIPKTGATLPTAINMTAVLKNIVGTVIFSVSAGSCGYSVNGNTITILPSGLTTTSATIKASVVADDGNTYSDVVTIAKVAEGTDSVVGLLSNEASVISTPYDGSITDFSKANGIYYVFDGLTNMTGNAAVTYSVVNPSGVTMSIAPSGAYTVTAITTDTASATLRAVYKGLTIDKLYTVAKSRTGANSQLVTITSDSQVFKVAKDGTVTPNSVNISAIGNNLNGSPTFALTSGTATLTGTGSSRIMSYSTMTTDAVTVQVTWDGKTDSITIVKVREGNDAIVGFLTNESSMVSASSNGTLTGSLTQLGGTFKVFSGLNDKTGDAAVTYSVANTTNMTGSIAPTGVYTITGITADAGSITFRAVYNGMTVDKVYSLTKAKAGQAGNRGNVSITYAITGSVWSDASANTALSNAGYGIAQNMDIVTLVNNSTSYSEARFYDQASTSWKTMAAYISGNLLVDGGVTSRTLATGAVTATNLAVGTGKNIIYNSGPGRDFAGWQVGWISNGSAFNCGIDSTWCPYGGNAAFLTLTGAQASGVLFDLLNSNGARKYPVKAKQRYEVSAYISAHRCSATVKVWWYDAAGNPISEDAGPAVTTAQNNTTLLANFSRSTLFVTAPDAAASCVVGVRGNTYADSDPYIFCSMTYFGEANPYQTIYSGWSDGGMTLIGPNGISTPNLSSISANIGYITAGEVHGGYFTCGAYNSNYAWPANGQGGGVHIGPGGILLGNPNQPGMGYFQIEASTGNLYLGYTGSEYLRVNSSGAVFSGNLRANIVDTTQLVDRSVSGTVTADFYIGPSASVWYMAPFQFTVPSQSYAHIFIELVGWPSSDQNQTVSCAAWVKRYGEQTYYPNLSDAKLSVQTTISQSQPASQPFMNRLDSGTWYINSWLQTADYMHDCTVRIYIYFIKK